MIGGIAASDVISAIRENEVASFKSPQKIMNELREEFQVSHSTSRNERIDSRQSLSAK
jgi:hypothetical protein